ncbi:hypothetical protein D0962_23325 [Leptolyngbyaceae cyanobacterium CCMR0082]|uniref:Uncharacterized protein n=1 Tax=Adonisia turfae CCMR0082 TaxID=2304604 RepID=A0A6M0SCD5_9CYAN|nr:hypothetical protein [Adonisia turfae CCMR0082]
MLLRSYCHTGKHNKAFQIYNWHFSLL